MVIIYNNVYYKTNLENFSNLSLVTQKNCIILFLTLHILNHQNSIFYDSSRFYL